MSDETDSLALFLLYPLPPGQGRTDTPNRYEERVDDKVEWYPVVGSSPFRRAHDGGWRGAGRSRHWVLDGGCELGHPELVRGGGGRERLCPGCWRDPVLRLEL